MTGEFKMGSSIDEEVSLTPIRLAIILIALLLFVPNGIHYNGYSHDIDDGYRPYISIFTLTWAYWTPGGWMNNIPGGLHILEPQVILMALFYVGFDIIFASLLILYIQGKTSKRMVLGFSVLALFIPLMSLLMALPVMIRMALSGTPFYMGPIPILLIFGLLLIRTKSKAQVTLWKGMEKPKEWWKSEEVHQ
jgi:hypothetical protein